MTWVLILLIAQGILGATDTFWYHEWKLRLANQPSQRFELRLHSVRTFIYVLLYLMFAWGEWRGPLAGLFVVLLLAEIVITMWDFVEEDRTRRLPAGERVMHGVLAVFYGAFLASFAPILWSWWQQPAGLVRSGNPLVTAFLVAMAAVAFVSGLRDFAASRPKPAAIA